LNCSVLAPPGVPRFARSAEPLQAKNRAVHL